MIGQTHKHAAIDQATDKMPPSQRHALTRQNGLDDQNVIVDLQSFRDAPSVDSDRAEPICPCRGGTVGFFQMDQLMQQQVRFCHWLGTSRKIARPTDRIDFFGGQRFGQIVWPMVRITAPHGKGDTLAQKVQIMIRGLNPQVDMGQFFAELRHPRHHPEGRKGRRTGQGDVATRRHRPQITGRTMNMG